MNQEAIAMSHTTKEASGKSSFLPISKLQIKSMFLIMVLSLAYVIYETQFVKNEAPNAIGLKKSAHLIFKDGQNGEIVIEVVNQVNNEINIIKEIRLQGEQGFVRGILRTMARERIKRQLSPSVPFELKLDQEDHLSLNDPLTKNEINLDAFGPDNVGVFLQIMIEIDKAMAKSKLPNSAESHTKETI